MDPARISRDRVMERWRGGFAGWSGVNDWVFAGKGGMACCNASGARALYDLWRYGITQRERRTSVNLLLSRATPDVTVKSLLPFVGRVEIVRRSDSTLRVRVPASSPIGQLRMEINGRGSPIRMDGPWLAIPDGKAGDRITIEFPLVERVETVYLGYQTFDAHYRGDTVVKIDPRGTVYPLYERAWASGPAPSIPDPAQSRGREIESI